MNQYKVIVKRVVSPNGKIIAETKSVVAVSSDGESEMSQSVSVEVSSTNNSISSSKSSSSSRVNQQDIRIIFSRMTLTNVEADTLVKSVVFEDFFDI